MQKNFTTMRHVTFCNPDGIAAALRKRGIVVVSVAGVPVAQLTSAQKDEYSFSENIPYILAAQAHSQEQFESIIATALRIDADYPLLVSAQPQEQETYTQL